MNLFYELLWLFLVYSFLGWIGECIVAAISQKRFVNRGLIHGPLCLLYGFTAVFMSIWLEELLEANILVMFIICAIVGGFLEWASGRLLERIFRRRWWDFSHHRFNIDGFVSLRSAILWGVLGSFALIIVNPILGWIYYTLYSPFFIIILLVVLGIAVLDIVYTALGLLGKELTQTQEDISGKLAKLSATIRNWIVSTVTKRISNAHPSASIRKEKHAKPTVFAQGVSFYKLFLLFMIGAFLGDVVETIFCRITGGAWISRSSVVWGPFSIVWGLAFALGTLFLYSYRNKSAIFLFWFGALLGGAYEYICSVFTEIVFGQVFWDYSKIPFNLGGRINLLYCLFWGVAAGVWLKICYPFLSKWIEKLPMLLGKIITWCLIVFMVCNMAVSGLALMRSSARNSGVAATASWEIWMDEHYSDEVLNKIYPNAVHVDTAAKKAAKAQKTTSQ